MKHLIEDSRSQLMAQSRNAEREKDGKTRFEKRLKSKVASSVKQYNQIDMNQLFKNNIITIHIEVVGETSNYIVSMSFGGFLDKLHNQLNHSDGKLNLRLIIRALIEAFNSDNVYMRCSCPDFQYRFSYWASKKDIIVGDKENRPADITNPEDNKGAACKHVMLVLSNTSWLIKTASVINNYIKYAEKHMKKAYADIIYPAVYDKEYEEPVQLTMFDKDELDTDTDTLDKSNEEGRLSGRFKSDISNPSIRKALERDIARKKAELGLNDSENTDEEEEI